MCLYKFIYSIIKMLSELKLSIFCCYVNNMIRQVTIKGSWNERRTEDSLSEIQISVKNKEAYKNGYT